MINHTVKRQINFGDEVYLFAFDAINQDENGEEMGATKHNFMS